MMLAPLRLTRPQTCFAGIGSQGNILLKAIIDAATGGPWGSSFAHDWDYWTILRNRKSGLDFPMTLTPEHLRPDQRRLTIKNVFATRNILKKLLINSRIACMAPSQANVSQTFMLDKKQQKRMHCVMYHHLLLLPALDAFVPSLDVERHAFPATGLGDGGTRHRRREIGARVPRIIMERLRIMKTAFALKSDDATAVFHGGSLEDLTERVRMRLLNTDEVNLNRLMSRKNYTAVKIDARDRPLYLHPGSGGTMGDSNEGDIFMSNFYSSIDAYRTESFFDVAAPLLASSLLTGDLRGADSSLVAFVDDIRRAIIIDDIDSVHIETNRDSLRLTQALANKDYYQNAAKADIAFYNRDRGKLREWLSDGRIAGHADTSLKHLGLWLDAFGSNKRNISERILAASAAWVDMGQFWFGKIRREILRLMFVVNVLSSLLSGLEALCLNRVNTGDWIDPLSRSCVR